MRPADPRQAGKRLSLQCTALGSNTDPRRRARVLMLEGTDGGCTRSIWSLAWVTVLVGQRHRLCAPDADVTVFEASHLREDHPAARTTSRGRDRGAAQGRAKRVAPCWRCPRRRTSCSWRLPSARVISSGSRAAMTCRAASSCSPACVPADRAASRRGCTLVPPVVLADISPASTLWYALGGPSTWRSACCSRCT